MTNLERQRRASAATFTAAVQIFDTLGAPHVATITYTKSAAAGAWNYEVTVPGADVAGGTAGTPFVVGNGTLVRRIGHALRRSTAARRPTSTITTPAWTNGAAASTWAWNIVDAERGRDAERLRVTVRHLVDHARTASPPGTVDNISITPDGTIVATFGAGQTVAIGQLALATLQQPEGLVKLGSNRYGESAGGGHAERRRRRHRRPRHADRIGARAVERRHRAGVHADDPRAARIPGELEDHHRLRRAPGRYAESEALIVTGAATRVAARS